MLVSNFNYIVYVSVYTVVKRCGFIEYFCDHVL